jgi:four helix bundle protein
MSQDSARLDHENLDAYRCSILFLRFAFELVATLPKAEAELRKQLKRASMSVPLNIAEGAGKPTFADRARFHAIARGSAMECGALLDVCAVARVLPNDRLAEGKALLVRIVAMLTKMCR